MLPGLVLNKQHGRIPFWGNNGLPDLWMRGASPALCWLGIAERRVGSMGGDAGISAAMTLRPPLVRHPALPHPPLPPNPGPPTSCCDQ